LIGQKSFTDVAPVEPHTWRKLIFRGRTIEGCDPMARFVEVAHHMGADEARGTGDENRKRGHAERGKSTASVLVVAKLAAEQYTLPMTLAG
jgi:hypothetical protein